MTESYNCLYPKDEKVNVLVSVSIQKQKFHAFLSFSNHPVHSGDKSYPGLRCIVTIVTNLCL